MKPVIVAVILVLLVALIIPNFLFVIDETKQALIVQLGDPVKVIIGDHAEEDQKSVQDYVDEWNRSSDRKVKLDVGPGLKFKIPLLQKVHKFEDRLLEYDSDAKDIVTADKKTLSVDNFARWRIINPLQFYQEVQTETRAQARLDDIIYSKLREELARSELTDIVRSTDREEISHPVNRGRKVIMDAVLEGSNRDCRQYGIKVLDVRIKRADLPKENEVAVFKRMIAERQRISKQYRSEGEEEATKIRAETDKDVKVIKAEAYKQAETIRGEGDGKAAAIYAEAYEQYEEFYEFSQSLDTLRKTTTPGTRLIISTDSGLYSHVKE